MTVIPQEELRNYVSEVLRRAEAGEEFTITVAGRPVAQLGPTRRREWLSGPELAMVWDTPAPHTLAEDLERFPGELADPFPQMRAHLDTSLPIGGLVDVRSPQPHARAGFTRQHHLAGWTRRRPMTRRRYLIVIEGGNGANYSAYAPDVPGCVATGATRENV